MGVQIATIDSRLQLELCAVARVIVSGIARLEKNIRLSGQTSPQQLLTISTSV